MKKLLKELNVETLQKNLIKANYLKKLTYSFIVIDLVSFSIMETLKIVFNEDKSIGSFQIVIFFGKVKN